MILTPAYGRDYKSRAALLADFDRNRDFITNEYNKRSTYINKEQIAIGTALIFRYCKNTRSFTYVVKG